MIVSRPAIFIIIWDNQPFAIHLHTEDPQVFFSVYMISPAIIDRACLETSLMQVAFLGERVVTVQAPTGLGVILT